VDVRGSDAGRDPYHAEMRRLALAAVIATAAGSVAPAASADVVTRAVKTQPFSVSYTMGGRLLTADGGGPGYVLGDGSSHRITRLLKTQRLAVARTTYTFATDERGRTVRLSLSRGNGGVRAAWSVEPADGVDYVVVKLAATLSQHFLGGGERRSEVDLQRKIIRLKVWNVCGANETAPWYLSSGGYGVLVDSSSVGSVGFPGAVDGPAYSCQWGTSPCPVASNVAAVQICERGSGLAYRVFGGTFDQVQREITSVVGRPALPSPSQFELIKWRDAVSGTSDLLDDVAGLRSRGIPIGWELLDNPWEACHGSLSFDPTAFPDPAGLIQSLRASGVRLMTWISPTVDPGCGAAAGYEGLIPAGGGLDAIDLTDGSNRTELQRRLVALLALGVAGFKGDRGDDVDLEHASLAAGYGQTLHNLYPVLFEQAVAHAADEAGLSPLPSIFRAGWTGSAPLVSGFWGGDQTGDLHGLRAAIRSAATAGLGGYSTWGSDIGGYISEGLRPDVFIRWAQLGAISPVFEVGGNGPQSRFWEFGATTTAQFRTFAILHYELFPYLYGLARAAHATGIPVLRPLAFGYPDDRAAWQHSLELLVGDDLVAAPVDREGQAVDFPVYLPKGGWVDVFAGTTQNGGQTLVRPTGLDDFPLYLRAGAAIRFNLRTARVWPDPWQTDDLERRDRIGWLYAPGGRTVAAGITATATSGGLSLGLRGSTAAQVLVLGRSKPAAVEIDGRRLAARADLTAASVGWRTEPAPFPGILLKLAPGSRVTIRWQNGSA
jgi:alpha-glucosidase (family GH31 glycosyl hydrolase)